MYQGEMMRKKRAKWLRHQLEIWSQRYATAKASNDLYIGFYAWFQIYDEGDFLKSRIGRKAKSDFNKKTFVGEPTACGLKMRDMKKWWHLAKGVKNS